MLPRRLRGHLVAVYDVVRWIDDLGDEAAGDRTALLTAFAADLATVWDGGEPRSAVLRRLVPTVAECRLDRQPFDDLVQANLRDQTVTSYRTYQDLLGYCALSAAPVGQMVLAIFDARSAENNLLSDRVCTALQLLEHWQDVAEDRAAGRVYLPQEDLDTYAVTHADLDQPRGTPEFRRLIQFQTERAVRLLESGAPLVGRLHGWARLAVGGYVAGGFAAARSIQAAGWDVLAGTPKTRRTDVVRQLFRQLRSAA